jgi:hypothetical protein
MLKQAGSNRKELEQVLKHYSDSPTDSLKLCAAEFLIMNMSLSQYTCDTGSLHLYRPVLKHLDSLMKTSSSDPLQEQWALLKKQYPLQAHVYHRTYPDIKHITADYLIHDINLSVDMWMGNPYRDSISFHDFCEYVLPYRKRPGTDCVNAARNFIGSDCFYAVSNFHCWNEIMN